MTAGDRRYQYGKANIAPLSGYRVTRASFAFGCKRHPSKPNVAQEWFSRDTTVELPVNPSTVLLPTAVPAEAREHLLCVSIDDVVSRAGGNGVHRWRIIWKGADTMGRRRRASTH